MESVQDRAFIWAQILKNTFFWFCIWFPAIFAFAGASDRREQKTRHSELQKYFYWPPLTSYCTYYCIYIQARMRKCWLPVRNITSFIDQLIRGCLLLWGLTLIDYDRLGTPVVLHKGAMAGDAYKDSFGGSRRIFWILAVTYFGFIHIRKSSQNAKEKFLVKWLLLTIFNIVDTLATPCNAREWPEMIDKKH